MSHFSKTIKSSISVSGLLLINSLAFANVCTNQNGALYCSAGEVESIYHVGNTFLSGTHVKGDATVIGDFQAENSEIGSGKITGDMNVSHFIVHNKLYSIGNFYSNNSEFLSYTKIVGNYEGNTNLFSSTAEIIGDSRFTKNTIKGPITLTGTITSESSTFSSQMTVNSCNVHLSHTSTSSIKINKQENCANGEQSVYLTSSKVNGDIIFSGNGKVYSKDSVINGRVIGGTVIQE